jgi:hypothetical protein
MKKAFFFVAISSIFVGRENNEDEKAVEEINFSTENSVQAALVDTIANGTFNSIESGYFNI